jgi:hypothetical protein
MRGVEAMLKKRGCKKPEETMQELSVIWIFQAKILMRIFGWASKKQNTKTLLVTYRVLVGPLPHSSNQILESKDKYLV